jgi:site-specific recombinase XerD
MILEFLDHLESARSNQPRSRNARLSAIRSFFKYASVRDVEHLAIANRGACDNRTNEPHDP